MFNPLDSNRVANLKRAYTTRNVPETTIRGITTSGTPEAGDVVIARVQELGQHQRLESPDGRRQFLLVDDEILVVYGNRYAPAQYEAVLPAALGPCDLVAAGGVAADALSQHSSKNNPTRLKAIGFATGPDGRRINLGDYRLPAIGHCTSRGMTTGDATDSADDHIHRPYTIVVSGTSMDSGKTTTAAALIAGLVRTGYRVGAAKVTGTGAGGDIWLMSDSGAAPVLDFTSVGMASTYLMGADAITEGFVTLTDHLAMAGIDIAVIEVADGVFHHETWDLLNSPEMWARADVMVFAAGDAAGAAAGLSKMRDASLPVVAVSGLLTASPLAIRETRSQVDVDVLDLARLGSADHNLVPTSVLSAGSGSGIASTGRAHAHRAAAPLASVAAAS